VPEPEVAQETEDQVDEDQVEHSLKLRLTKLAEEDHAEYDEMTLRDFYAAVVASGAEEAAALEDHRPQIEAPGASRMDRETVQRVLSGLDKRLSELQLISPPPADTQSTEIEKVDVVTEQAIRTAAGLSVISIPSSSTATIGFSVKGKEKEVVRPADVSVGLVSHTEWEALFESFVSGQGPLRRGCSWQMYRRDTRGAEALLAVMMVSDPPPMVAVVDDVATRHAPGGGTAQQGHSL
jgi:hypothetical protein